MAFSASLLVASLLTPAALRAQTTPTLSDTQKLSMMVDALDAESPTDGSAPNLAKAKDLLTQLHNASPEDDNITAQLKNVDGLIAKASAPAPASPAPAAATAARQQLIPVLLTRLPLTKPPPTKLLPIKPPRTRPPRTKRPPTRPPPTRLLPKPPL